MRRHLFVTAATLFLVAGVVTLCVGGFWYGDSIMYVLSPHITPEGKWVHEPNWSNAEDTEEAKRLISGLVGGLFAETKYRRLQAKWLLLSAALSTVSAFLFCRAATKRQPANQQSHPIAGKPGSG